MAFELSGILSLNNKPFVGGLKQSERATNRLNKSVSSARKSVGGLFKTAATIGGALGIAKMAKDSVMLASDLVEVQNVVDTTFKGASKTIDEFAKTTATQFGVSELEAKKFTGTLGAIMKSSGVTGDELTNMSIGLAGLAGDMASFYNLEPEEAFNKLRSAIGGEIEPMKALGVNMSVANMEAFALTKGIKKQWKEMSQAEQTTLRYKYIMNATADSQGDFAKTNKTFANQMRIAKLNVRDLGARMASGLLPHLNDGLLAFNGFITSLSDSDTKAGKFAQGLKNAVIPQLKGVKNFIATSVIPKFEEMGKTIYSIYKTHEPQLSAAFNSIKDVAASLVKIGLDVVNGALQWVADNEPIVTKSIGIIEGAFSGLADILNGDLDQGFQKLFTSLGKIPTLLTDTLESFSTSENQFLNFLAEGAMVFPGSEAVLSEQGRVSRQEKVWQENRASLQQFKEDPSVGSFARFLFGAPKKTEENANGTAYFKGGLSKVNERGGEMQVLRNGTSVIPADRTKQLLENQNQQQSQTIQIMLDGKVLTETVLDNFVPELKLVMANM